MKTKSKKITRVLLIVCAALVVALALAQFVPYWTYENAETASTDTISIFEYLILPTSHTDVTSALDAGTNEAINSLAGTFCIIYLLGLVTVIFVIIKPTSLWICVWPLATGVGSLIGYLTEPRWQMGSIYIVLVILSALLTLASIYPLITWIKYIRYWFMDPKDVPKD